MSFKYNLDDVVKTFCESVSNDTGVKTNLTSSVAGLLYKDGSVFHQTSYACYGWTYSYIGRSDVAALLTHLKHNVNILCEEYLYKYVDYIVNRSPYSGSTHNSAEHIIKNRVVIGNIDQAYNVLYGCLFSLRIVYEHPEMVVIWNRLVNAGLTENEAFFYTSVLMGSSGCYDQIKGTNNADFKVWVNCPNPSDHMPLYYLT